MFSREDTVPRPTKLLLRYYYLCYHYINFRSEYEIIGYRSLDVLQNIIPFRYDTRVA
jgi:hypothetical protein